MNQTYQILEFNKIIELLKEYAYTQKAKQQMEQILPMLEESKLKKCLEETSQARLILDQFGMPPLVGLYQLEDILLSAGQGDCLMPEQLEQVRDALTAVMRMKDFLNRCKQLAISLPYYEEQLNDLPDIKEEIIQKIRNGKIDDHASRQLRDIRQEIVKVDSGMRAKADQLLKTNKAYCSDSFITVKSGRLCLPIKKEHKNKISGSVVDTSSTGMTVFMEPSQISKMSDELIYLRLDEENEERRILYTLSAMISDQVDVFKENIRVLEKLDFIFAKGKLSFDMNAVCPQITTQRHIKIKEGRHPFLSQETCVPLDFEVGGETRGIVITGPNTGGKTVAIKTVGLLSLMAQCGLHVPCRDGLFAMNNLVLCDIGDGQNITENLSTFSAHITNILDILQKAGRESLVILDELGSGTDPAEGMGIAIAILEELRKSGCLFLVTTHYPEVKSYALKQSEILNARMQFDRKSLRPEYRLEIGHAGESCALYIARRLGMPKEMLIAAGKAAYGDESEEVLKDVFGEKTEGEESSQSNLSHHKADSKAYVPKIQKYKQKPEKGKWEHEYQIGDSVMIYPDKKIGIVCRKADEKGVLQLQLRDKKIWINRKRIKLHVEAKQLYPENYDFSIIFESADVRKAKHEMSRKYRSDLEIREP